MRWVWVAWIIAPLIAFAIFEGYALKNNRTTLSRLVWNATRAWPPLPFVIGVVVGMLASHFWWIGQACDLVTQ